MSAALLDRYTGKTLHDNFIFIREISRKYSLTTYKVDKTSVTERS